jgi:hypothetical protein
MELFGGIVTFEVVEVMADDFIFSQNKVGATAECAVTDRRAIDSREVVTVSFW